MDPDATLDWLLRIRATLDNEAEEGIEPDPRAIYALLGLIEALDEWLRAGRRPPRRWLSAFDRKVIETTKQLLQSTTQPHNDPPPPSNMRPSGKSRSQRKTRRGAPEGQLALPFVHATG